MILTNYVDKTTRDDEIENVEEIISFQSNCKRDVRVKYIWAA